MITWNAGRIDWSQVNGTTNVVQVNQNATNSAIQVYAWRNELPGESCLQACIQFAGQFNFAAAGALLVPCVVQEWSPQGTALIQTREFGFSPDDLYLFTEEGGLDSWGSI